MKTTKRPRLFNKLFTLLPTTAIREVIKKHQGDKYRKKHSVIEFIRISALSLFNEANSLNETICEVHENKKMSNLVNPHGEPISRAQFYKMNTRISTEMLV